MSAESNLTGMESNLDHAGRHRVQPEEAEQVTVKDPMDLGIEIVEGTRWIEELWVLSSRRRDRSRSLLFRFGPLEACADHVRRMRAFQRKIWSFVENASIMERVVSLRALGSNCARSATA